MLLIASNMPLRQQLQTFLWNTETATWRRLHGFPPAKTIPNACRNLTIEMCSYNHVFAPSPEPDMQSSLSLGDLVCNLVVISRRNANQMVSKAVRWWPEPIVSRPKDVLRYAIFLPPKLVIFSRHIPLLITTWSFCFSRAASIISRNWGFRDLNICFAYASSSGDGDGNGSCLILWWSAWRLRWRPMFSLQ